MDCVMGISSYFWHWGHEEKGQEGRGRARGRKEQDGMGRQCSPNRCSFESQFRLAFHSVLLKSGVDP